MLSTSTGPSQVGLARFGAALLLAGQLLFLISGAADAQPGPGRRPIANDLSFSDPIFEALDAGTLFSGAPSNDLLSVEAIAEDGRATTAVVGHGGGVITATARDGTSYELTIPAGALAEPLSITLSVMADVRGGPSKGEGAGVLIAPHGIDLAETATLRIIRRGIGQQLNAYGLALAASGTGTGTDLRLELAVVSDDTVWIPVQHFTIFRIDQSGLIDAVKGQLRKSAQITHSRANLSTVTSIAELRRIERKEAGRARQIIKQIADAITAISKPETSSTSRCKLLLSGVRAAFEASKRRQWLSDNSLDWLRELYVVGGATAQGDRIDGWFDDATWVSLRDALKACREEAEEACRKTHSGKPIDAHASAEKNWRGLPELVGPSITGEMAEISAWRAEALDRCLRYDVVITDSGVSHEWPLRTIDLPNCHERGKFVFSAELSSQRRSEAKRMEGNHQVSVAELRQLRCPFGPGKSAYGYRTASSRDPIAVRVTVSEDLGTPVVDVWPGSIMAMHSEGGEIDLIDGLWTDCFGTYRTQTDQGVAYRFAFTTPMQAHGGTAQTFRCRGKISGAPSNDINLDGVMHISVVHRPVSR